MANSVTTQVILDGPRNAVVKIEGVLDTSDLTSTVIIDPSTMQGIDNTGLVKALKVRLLEATWVVEDTLSVNLFWDATTPVRIGEFTGRGETKSKKFGGFVNNGGAGVTGKITMTTEGWAAGKILSFMIVLELIKQQT
jgi:hypothetical protein